MMNLTGPRLFLPTPISDTIVCLCFIFKQLHLLLKPKPSFFTLISCFYLFLFLTGNMLHFLFSFSEHLSSCSRAVFHKRVNSSQEGFYHACLSVINPLSSDVKKKRRKRRTLTIYCIKTWVFAEKCILISLGIKI